MSKFEDLREAYKTYREKNIQLWHNARNLARLIAGEFRDYIAAPKSYSDFESKRDRPYVEVWSWNDDQLRRPANFFEVFEQREEDGSFRFGVVIILDYAENSWPKEPFGVTVQMHLTDAECRLKVAKEKEFTFAINDAAARQPLYAFMAEVIARGFAQEPWDMPEKKLMGFIQVG